LYEVATKVVAARRALAQTTTALPFALIAALAEPAIATPLNLVLATHASRRRRG